MTHTEYVSFFVLVLSVFMQVQDLTGQVTKSPGVYIAYGGFSDIYKGTWRNPDTGQSTVVSHWWVPMLLLPNMILDCYQAITYRIHRPSRLGSNVQGTFLHHYLQARFCLLR